MGAASFIGRSGSISLRWRGRISNSSRGGTGLATCPNSTRRRRRVLAISCSSVADFDVFRGCLGFDLVGRGRRLNRWRMSCLCLCSTGRRFRSGRARALRWRACASLALGPLWFGGRCGRVGRYRIRPVQVLLLPPRFWRIHFVPRGTFLVGRRMLFFWRTS